MKGEEGKAEEEQYPVQVMVTHTSLIFCGSWFISICTIVILKILFLLVMVFRQRAFASAVSAVCGIFVCVMLVEALI